MESGNEKQGTGEQGHRAGNEGEQEAVTIYGKCSEKRSSCTELAWGSPSGCITCDKAEIFI